MAFWFKRAIFSFNPRQNHRYHRSKLGLSSWPEEASTSFNSPNGFLNFIHAGIYWDQKSLFVQNPGLERDLGRRDPSPAEDRRDLLQIRWVLVRCWSHTDMNLQCWKFGSLVNQVTLQHIIPSGFNAISHTQNEHPSESNATQKGLDLLNYRFTKTSLHLLGWVPIMFRTQNFATACYSYILLI